MSVCECMFVKKMEEIKILCEKLFSNSNTDLQTILEEYRIACNKREEYELGFNIFSLVSDTYYKENLHSAILKSILEPNELHKEGDLYLRLFIEYLNKEFGYEIKMENYKNVKVTNETDGRIDISIKSATHAIIIENKINDAGDMENQVLRYYLKCKNLKVDAILYLTKEGIREPKYNTWTNNYDDKEITKKVFETSKVKIKNILKPIACFDITGTKDLCNGWLNYCIGQSKHIDNIFILKQYKQLLKHLRQFIMEQKSIEKFYLYLSEGKLADKAKSINNLFNELPNYYPKFIHDKLLEIKNPFFANYKIEHHHDKLNIRNIWDNSNYYLQLHFLPQSFINILIYDDSNEWQFDEYFRKNNILSDLKFYEDNDTQWKLELNLNLINEIELKELLSLVVNLVSIKFKDEPIV